MFSDKSFDYEGFRTSLGEVNYQDRFIPQDKESYINQMIQNDVSLKIYLSSVKEYPLKSEHIIKINELQQKGIVKEYGIKGRRDFQFNDHPVSKVIQTCHPSRIKGELKILDVQVDKMWKASETTTEKIKTLSFQAARLLSLQAFDDANKRAIKATLDHSIKKLINDDDIKIEVDNVSWTCISSLSCTQAVHGNNIAGFSKEICNVYNLKSLEKKISNHEIPPYQVMAKPPTKEELRADATGVAVHWKEKPLDIKKELLDSKLHDKKFSTNIDDEVQWVRPSYINNKVADGTIKKKGIFKKKSAGDKLLKPMSRADFLATLKKSDIPKEIKEKLAYTPLVNKIQNKASSAIQASKIFTSTNLSDLDNIIKYIDIKELVPTENKLGTSRKGLSERATENIAKTVPLKKSEEVKVKKQETKSLRERVKETARKDKGITR